VPRVLVGHATCAGWPSPLPYGEAAECPCSHHTAVQLITGEQLVLMDAGCELHGYVSDVTRTWPVSGRFSSPQRDVYEAVLGAHTRWVLTRSAIMRLLAAIARLQVCVCVCVGGCVPAPGGCAASGPLY